MFAGEAGEGEGGEEEMTGGDFSTATSTGTFTVQARNFCFLALEFHSQNTHACMRIRNRRTYIIYKYISRDSIDMTK